MDWVVQIQTENIFSVSSMENWLAFNTRKFSVKINHMEQLSDQTQFLVDQYCTWTDKLKDLLREEK